MGDCIVEEGHGNNWSVVSPGHLELRGTSAQWDQSGGIINDQAYGYTRSTADLDIPRPPHGRHYSLGVASRQRDEGNRRLHDERRLRVYDSGAHPPGGATPRLRHAAAARLLHREPRHAG